MKAPIWSCYFQWILRDLQSGFYRNFYVKISSPDRYSDCSRISKTKIIESVIFGIEFQLNIDKIDV